MGKKGKAAKKGGGPRAPAARLSPQQLYEQAQLALQFDDFDAARTALRKAVKLDPSNIECMDALGALLAEVGPEEEAVQVLRQAVSLSPDAGYEKYLYLGQLMETAAEAVAATRKGVQLLQAQHAATQAASSPDAAVLGRALAGALCSLSEMLMASSGAGAGAEAGAGAAGSSGGGGVAAVAEEAEGLLALAASVDPESPEPGQALAALRNEQGRAAEALKVQEDDRVPDAWHLLALAYYSGHQYAEAAEVLAKGQALLKAMGAGPKDEITQVFADLQSAIKEALELAQPGQQGGPGEPQCS
ncbi:hypothetical protein TSOC_003022 [Tetrabaena socialis]|uniref:Uncharacterized protein n=1 Tax=Tetrabaena socialis TaxID=47790 RepID=A0A2J8ACM9_9CHLO|nr:hypothetical protein TSOC_003022 [Tetrabaena socialis]|eukprot:PNH10263.1 hypothetical protein TSOC_003022 [Tetrabaena socialis]